MNKYQKEYIVRINRVLNHIEKNLDQQMNIREVANVACFSPYHFHRIFSAFVGETLKTYISRKRTEKAAQYLYQEQDVAISEISDRLGFSSPSVFCRNFKTRFGMSAEQFRENPDIVFRKNRQLQRKKRQLHISDKDYVCIEQIQKIGGNMLNKGIQIQEMPNVKLATIRHTGDFHLIGEVYGRLMKWAGPRGILNNTEVKTVTVYHDDPNVTEIDKVRQSACVTLTEPIKPDGEIGYMELEGSKCVVGRFEIGPMEFEQAWNEVCVWMSESGYQPEDKSPYELYHKDMSDDPKSKFVLDICMPIKPL